MTTYNTLHDAKAAAEAKTAAYMKLGPGAGHVKSSFFIVPAPDTGYAVVSPLDVRPYQRDGHDIRRYFDWPSENGLS
jgi:hypothetical protein